MRWLSIPLALLLAACGSTPVVEPETSPGGNLTIIQLPAPAHEPSLPLDQALATRRSVREYTEEPLDRAVL